MSDIEVEQDLFGLGSLESLTLSAIRANNC